MIEARFARPLRTASREARPETQRGAAPPDLAQAQLHEVYARTQDRAAALAFTLFDKEAKQDGTIVLVRARKQSGPRLALHGDGLAMMGCDPARLVIVEAESQIDLLRAGLDAARCAAASRIILESSGRFADYDLTASRRLALAAERSRNRIILLRHDAEPRPSAARTRWVISAAPSLALAANAPGLPALEAQLIYARGGPAGQSWRLEWNEDNGYFNTAPKAHPLSGTQVNLPPGVTPLFGTLVSLSRLRAGVGHRDQQARAA